MTDDPITDDTPLRLDVAAHVAFPYGEISGKALLKEAKAGNLKVFGDPKYPATTLSAIREMRELKI